MKRWGAGGQSVRAFCRSEGVTEPSFYYWRRELARRAAHKSYIASLMRSAAQS
jgi:transposase-like protein